MDYQITPYMQKLMQQGKTTVFFPDNNQLLVGENELDEFNKIHGHTSPIRRVIFGKHNTHQGEFYVVKDTSEITTTIIPMDVVNMEYDDFIRDVKEAKK